MCLVKGCLQDGAGFRAWVSELPRKASFNPPRPCFCGSSVLQSSYHRVGALRLGLEGVSSKTQQSTQEPKPSAQPKAPNSTLNPEAQALEPRNHVPCTMDLTELFELGSASRHFTESYHNPMSKAYMKKHTP